ncbi:hypothetical protein [Streptomyces sp. NPDC088258]|uniref:hypothetical protein n=1 Tax=Streptomyces sp. NPDC088258 TaxID=3365849 RepID=UPI003811B300
MASPGYGKRSVPGRSGPPGDDFAGLPAREASIAGFIDRLPEGADISVKALAKVLDYGQCALRTALNHLQRTGHLRRGREHLVTVGAARWVTRTWFSRTARDDSWWASFVAGERSGEVSGEAAGDVPGDAAEGAGDEGAGGAGARCAPPVPTPARSGSRSRAYAVLAAVGRRNPVVSLSAADCAALEPLAAEWFVRGAREDDVLRALTHGLPAVVHHPAGMIRNRLTAKLPPELPEPTGPPEPPGPEVVVRPPLRILECSTCRAPGRPEALVGGECGECRGLAVPVRHPVPLSPEQVHARASQARTAARA